MGVSGAFFLCCCGRKEEGGWEEGKKERVDEVVREAVEKDTRGMSEGRGDESECTVALEIGEAVWSGGGLIISSAIVMASRHELW